MNYRDWLRNEREQRGMSRGALSMEAGVSARVIEAIEMGETRSPTVDTAQKLSRALGYEFRLIDRRLNREPVYAKREAPDPEMVWLEDAEGDAVTIRAATDIYRDMEVERLIDDGYRFRDE